jgi:uncharacterized protein YbaP (TraB family)
MAICISVLARGALRCLLALAAGAGLLLPASPSFADPAMWVVKDADSTIYLLGTFHLVKPGTHWQSDRIEQAFKSSDDLWLEASVNGDNALIQSLVLKHGIDRAHPLSSKLDPADWTRVKAAAKTIGAPAQAFDAMRPWLAALTLAVAPLIKEGYDPSKGVDHELEAEARASHKTVKTFETPEQQIMFFAALPEPAEIAFLAQTLDELDAGPKFTDQLTSAWVAGDISQLDAVMVQKMRTAAPDLYQTLIVQRNLDWSDRIAAMMKGSGTSFIAVGAGHLVGDRSVPAILSERGFQVAPY